MNQSIYQAMSEVEKNNEFAVLCTVVKSEGSTPRHVGSKMLVYADGKFIGTVGGGDLEHRVMDEAWMAISDGKARVLTYSMIDPAAATRVFAVGLWRCLWNLSFPLP